MRRKITTFMAVAVLSVAAFACGATADVAAPVKSGAQSVERAVRHQAPAAFAVSGGARTLASRPPRICVRRPRGVEAIPSVGPAITAYQCAVIR